MSTKLLSLLLAYALLSVNIIYDHEPAKDSRSYTLRANSSEIKISNDIIQALSGQAARPAISKASSAGSIFNFWRKNPEDDIIRGLIQQKTGLVINLSISSENIKMAKELLARHGDFDVYKWTAGKSRKTYVQILTPNSFRPNTRRVFRTSSAGEMRGPKENAIRHHHLSLSHHPESYARSLERRKMYEALLMPDQNSKNSQDGRERFLQMFDPSHPRSLMFKTRRLSSGTVQVNDGIMYKKDILMLVLIYAAMRSSAESDPSVLVSTVYRNIITQKKGNPVVVTPDDINIISLFLKGENLKEKRVKIKDSSKPSGFRITNINAALNELLKGDVHLHLSDEAAKGFLSSISKRLYEGYVARPVVYQQMDLFREKLKEDFINQAA